MSKKVIIIGAGMAGFGAALKLLESGYKCTLIEQASAVGGLAGSFEIRGKHFPFGYHHILSEDKPLLAILNKLDILKDVKWKRGKVLFAIDNKIYNLTNSIDFLKFPMPLWAKIRFVFLMGYCFLRSDWSGDLGNARDWIDKIAGATVRKTIFDPLMDIKYGLPSAHLSANWIGSRLHCQEFSKPLGYIQGTDWTKVLNNKLAEEVRARGGEIILGAKVTRIDLGSHGFERVVYEREGSTETLSGDILVSTAPPHVFLKMADYHDQKLEGIAYLDALSLILETKQKLSRELYLLSCLSPRYSFGGIFMLSSLNNIIGVNGGTVINFFTTLSAGSEYLRGKNSDELFEIYQQDFYKLFGFRLQPEWYHLSLIKNYSPKFLNGYQNAERRGNIKGVYFAGNYLTYPEITSTGSAFASGESAAKFIIEDYEDCEQCG